MQSQQNLADKLHRTPNNLQNTQHKLGIAYLERILTYCTVSIMQWGYGGAYNIKKRANVKYLQILIIFLINLLLDINVEREKIIFTKQYKIRSLTDNLQQINFKFMKVHLTLEAFLKGAVDAYETL